jgi:hypothetical protein
MLRRRFRYRGFVYYEDPPGLFEMRIGIKNHRTSSHQAMQLVVDDFIGNPKANIRECYPKEVFDETQPAPAPYTIEYPTPAGQAGGIPTKFRILSRISEWWRPSKVHGGGTRTL